MGDICSDFGHRTARERLYSEMVTASNEVNNPDHYNNGTIECIVYLRDNMTHEGFCGYLEGNAKKYLHRFRYKGKAKQDLQKAQWYLAKLIEEQE